MAKATSRRRERKPATILLHAVQYLLVTRKYSSRQEHFNGSMAAIVLAKALAKVQYA